MWALIVLTLWPRLVRLLSYPSGMGMQGETAEIADVAEIVETVEMMEIAEMVQTTEIGNSGNGENSGNGRNSGNGLLQIWPPLQAQRRLSRIVVPSHRGVTRARQEVLKGDHYGEVPLYWHSKFYCSWIIAINVHSNFDRAVL